MVVEPEPEPAPSPELDQPSKDWRGVRREVESSTHLLERHVITTKREKTGFNEPTSKGQGGWSVDTAGFRTLRTITLKPAGTRTYSEVQALMRVLRGSELDQISEAFSVAAICGGAALEEHPKGATVAQEETASDTYVLILSGSLTLYARNFIEGCRSPMLRLHQGECFSEEALLECNYVSAPSLEAEDGAVLLLRVGRADFQTSLGVWEELMLERKVALLANLPSFVGVGRSSLRQLAEKMERNPRCVRPLRTAHPDPALKPPVCAAQDLGARGGAAAAVCRGEAHRHHRLGAGARARQAGRLGLRLGRLGEAAARGEDVRAAAGR